MKYILLFSFLFVFSFSHSQTPPLFKVKVEAYGGDGNCNGFIRLSGCGNYTYYTSGGQNINSNSTFISPLCSGSYTVVVSDANLNYVDFGFTIWSNFTSIYGANQNLELFSTSGNYYPAANVPPNCNDSISLNINDGYPPYSISWSDSLFHPLLNESDSVLQNICSPNYLFSISDAGFCTNSVGNNYVKLIDNKSALEIFPNPSNGNISIKSSKSISKIEIKSIAGQIVYEENSLNLVEKTFSLNLAKGIYFVVSTNSNGLCYFEKLVIN